MGMNCNEAILDDYNPVDYQAHDPEVVKDLAEDDAKSEDGVSWDLNDSIESVSKIEDNSTEQSSYDFDVEIRSDDSIFDDIYKFNADKLSSSLPELSLNVENLPLTEVPEVRGSGMNGIVAEPTQSELEENSCGFVEPFYEYMNKLYAVADWDGLTGAHSEDEALSSASERDYIRGTEEEETSTGWAALGRLPDPWAEARHPTPTFFPHQGLGSQEISEDLQYKTIAGGIGNLALPPGCTQYACTKLQLPFKGIKTIGILTKYKYLQYIDLSGNNIQDIRPLWEIPHLVVLDVSQNHVDDVGVGLPAGPIFLTYLNLASNNLKSIPDFSAFWALKHLDLADNKIRVIENLDHLEYLQYLNLSRNIIKHVKNLFNAQLKEIDLSMNHIKTWSKEVTNNLTSLQILNISDNNLTTLETMRELSNLQKLDISYNNITNIIDLENLKCLDSLKELTLVENELNSTIPDIRKLIIFNNPNIKVLNCIPVHYRERANAEQTFGMSTDLMTKDVSTFYRKLCTSPFSNTAKVKPIGFHPAIVIIVSVVGCCQPEILLEVQQREPWKVKIVKQFTTQPKLLDQSTGRPDISSALYKYVSPKKFYQMDSEGYFIKTFGYLGYKYGIPIAELGCSNKVVLTVMNLSAALKLMWDGYNPILLLMFPECTELLKDLILDWFDKTRTGRAHEYRRQSRLVLKQCFRRSHSANSMGHKESKREPNYFKSGLMNMENIHSRKLIRKYSQRVNRRLRHGRESRNVSVHSLRKRYRKHMKLRKSLNVPHIPIYFSKTTEETRFMDYIIRSRDAVLKEHVNNPGLFRLYIPTDDCSLATNKLRTIIDEAYDKLQHELETAHKNIQFIDNPLFGEMVMPHIREYVNEIVTNRLPPDLIH